MKVRLNGVIYNVLESWQQSYYDDGCWILETKYKLDNGQFVYSDEVEVVE